MAFVSDLRVALRTLLRAPGFFAMAAGVLALGIAAVVVMLGFLRVTMTPPSLDRVDRVFSLLIRDVRRGNPDGWIALHDVEDWRREQRSFEDVAGVGLESVSFRREGATAERYPAARVTGPFFSLLRVKPLVGRTLTADDARPRAAPAVVLSEPLWRSAFGSEASVVGESVRLNGERYTVVGVAPAALDVPASALLWFADRTDTTVDPQALKGAGPLPRLLAPYFAPIGRLREGVTPEAAQAELQIIQQRRVARYPEIADEHPEVRPFSLLWMGSEYQRLLRVLFGGVVLVLVLACVNVAGLLLVRGARRTHEAAVRRALGAGPLRLASQMLAESVIIGAGAVLLALVFAQATLEVLHRVIPAVLPAAPSWWRVRLDLVTVTFALATGMAAALGAGAYPALRTSRVPVDPVLREGQRETGLHATRLVRWLVVLEIALSSALLTAAGLVIRSASKLGAGDVGVPTAGILMARVELPRRYDFAAQHWFIIGLTSRLQAIPGVESVGVSTSPPGITAYWKPGYQLPDRSNPRIEELPTAAVIFASPGFFETFHLGVRGRTFLDTDADSRNSVAVVSESMARTAWPGENPIGKSFRIAPQETWLPPVTVIGVAQDVRYDERLLAQGSRPPVVYVCLFQWPNPALYLTLRAPREPLAVAEGIRAAVRSLDADVPVFSIRPLDEERRRNAAGLTLVGRMFAVFGGVALALAAAGVYGVLAYSVTQGAREIAIRRALGAPRWLLVAAVLARSGWQLVLGLALGLILAPLVRALVGSIVVQADSGLTVYLGVAAVLTVTLLASVLLPLRRALALEPAASLHHT